MLKKSRLRMLVSMTAAMCALASCTRTDAKADLELTCSKVKINGGFFENGVSAMDRCVNKEVVCYALAHNFSCIPR